MLAPPPVIRYSPFAALYSADPVFGVMPISPRVSKIPSRPEGCCCAMRVAAKSEKARIVRVFIGVGSTTIAHPRSECVKAYKQGMLWSGRYGNETHPFIRHRHGGGTGTGGPSEAGE